MDALPLEALSMDRLLPGYLALKLTECVEWEDFPAYAHKFLQAVGGEVLKKNDAADTRIWEVKIDGATLWLVYEDYPQMISLEPSGQACDALIQSLHQKLKEGA